MGQKSGFMLVELLAVMSICGLLLSFSFPALARFRASLYLEASAKERVAEIRKAQGLAMSKGETQSSGKFKFSATGFPVPGGSGTEILEGRNGFNRKVIVSSVGRVRIE